MKVFLILFSFFVLLGCKVEPIVELDQINGYWQIEFVQQENEPFKSNQLNLLYDFYSMKNNEGIYKKVAPQIDGSFQTSESAISFEIIRDDGNFIIQFTTLWNTWIKIIKHLDSERLVLFHEQRSFHYKRPAISKINLKND